MITSHAIHAIILTLDEEKHIARCIKSIAGRCASITVIDSGSLDRTSQIAKDLGAEVVFNKFVNHAGQVNFGIDYLAARGGWLLRIDADEILEPESAEALAAFVRTVSDDTAGILLKRRLHFLGRRIRHGAMEPSWQMRLWRNGAGRCEQRWMDEHVIVDGAIVKSELVLADVNLNTITWWTNKHNSYASREAIEFVMDSRKPAVGLRGQAGLRRFLKQRVYARLPSGLRALLYFIYRYLFRLGFLDGRSGFYFHVLQAFWYRTLVDAKIYEIEKLRHTESLSIEAAIEKATGIRV